MAASKDTDVVTEARRLAKIAVEDKWKLPTGLVAADMVKAADGAALSLDDINSVRKTLKTKISAKDKVIRDLTKQIVRLRGGIKTEYGDDSLEYEKAGGTRASERKRRAPKAAAAT